MKLKRITVRIEPKIFIGQYDSVIIGSETEAELEPGDNEVECRKKLAEGIREFIASEYDEHWKLNK